MDEQILETLPRYSWAEIKKHFADKQPFEAISPMATSWIRVKSYEPCIGLALHAGHRVRDELQSKMAIEEEERRYEEDAGVEKIISDLPVQMIALDSRYEYDVNRPRARSVYLKPFESWGKKVWHHPPSKDELEISYQKYDEFHELLEYMLEELNALQGTTLIIDTHSYNHDRPNLAHRADTLPLFNIGTTCIDRKKHANVIDFCLAELAKADIPNVATTVQENDLFKGDGAIVKGLAEKFPDGPILSLEIKKAYLDPRSGEPVIDILESLTKTISHLSRQIRENLLGRSTL